MSQKDNIQQEEIQQEEIQQETVINENNEEATNEEVTTEENQPSELELLQQELETQKDKYLRLSAEFDNYRKRTMKEKAELILNGGEKCIVSILPIIDDFERALQTMENKDTDANYEGVLLIYNKFKRTLEQNGLEEINAKDAIFDTDEHEALTNVPVTDESQKGKVLDVIQKGYKLNGKVIRYARVVVGG